MRLSPLVQAWLHTSLAFKHSTNPPAIATTHVSLQSSRNDLAIRGIRWKQDSASSSHECCGNIRWKYLRNSAESQGTVSIKLLSNASQMSSQAISLFDDMPDYLPIYLPTFLPTYLPTFLPTYLHTHLPTYLACV